MVGPGLVPSRAPRAWWRRRIVTVLAVTLLAGASIVVPAAAFAAPAGAGPARPVLAASSSTKWDPRIEPIAKEVAKLRKLDFEHPVPVEFLDDKAFDKKVTVDSDKLSKAAKKSYSESTARLAALGLVPHGADLVQAQNDLQSSAVLALYVPAKKRIFVRGTDVDTPDAKVTVAHELTHALQDQHFDLTKLDERAAKTKSSEVLRALVEGDAVRVQNLYAKTLSTADQQAYAQANQAAVGDSAKASDAADVPEALSAFLGAPYALGEAMLQVVLADKGESSLDQLFDDPPTTELAYLLPTTLVDGTTLPHVATPSVDGPGEKRLGKPDTFGAFALYLVLSQQLGPGRALDIADGWGGDAMVDYRKGGQQCVRAAFVGRTTDDTQAIRDGLNDWAMAQPAGSATVSSPGGKVLLSSCDVATPRAVAPHGANEALTLVANRNALLGEIMKEGVPRAVALCTSDGTVQDPTFQPLLQANVDDPSAEPDPDALAALRSRVTAIARECATTGSSSAAT